MDEQDVVDTECSEEVLIVLSLHNCSTYVSVGLNGAGLQRKGVSALLQLVHYTLVPLRRWDLVHHVAHVSLNLR